PQVLGDGRGHLDLTNLGSLLNKLPGEGINGPEGITILPVTNGLNVEGLPFGSSLTLTASTQNGVGIGVGLAPNFSPPIPSVAINAGLSFGGGVGVAVDGDVTLSIDLGNDAVLILESSYGERGRGQFALDFTAQLGGQTYPVTLIPFGGLNQFIPSGGVPQVLLIFISHKLKG